jgi:hypothetical protein
MMWNTSGRRSARAIVAGLAVVAVFSPSSVLAEPPIRSPEDAACRAEAKAKVFSAPNPKGLEIEEVGRGIYYACMGRLKPAAAPSRGHRRRHHAR